VGREPNREAGKGNIEAKDQGKGTRGKDPENLVRVLGPCINMRYHPNLAVRLGG
jgi:hypothetical protein